MTLVVGRDAQGLEQRGDALGDALGVGRQPEILQHDRRLVPAQRGNGRGRGPPPSCTS